MDEDRRTPSQLPAPLCEERHGNLPARSGGFRRVDAVKLTELSGSVRSKRRESVVVKAWIRTTTERPARNNPVRHLLPCMSVCSCMRGIIIGAFPKMGEGVCTFFRHVEMFGPTHPKGRRNANYRQSKSRRRQRLPQLTELTSPTEEGVDFRRSYNPVSESMRSHLCLVFTLTILATRVSTPIET